MDKNYISERTGSTEQIVYAKRAILSGGKAEGMKVIDIDNGGGLGLTLLESRCLDIAKLSYKGLNMGFLSKAGLVSPQNFGACMNRFHGHFPGGMLYTCGLQNTGPASDKNGVPLPVHGTIGMTPADDVHAAVDWDKKVITVEGRMRQAELFGKNIVLKRKITVPFFEGKVNICDTVENEGFSEEDIMILYHFNFGYPMLSEHLKLDISENTVIPRDSDARKGMDKWNLFETPTPNRPEEVFYHSPKAAADGRVKVLLENKDIEIAAELSYDKNQLAQLVQWKSMASGDYALGIEPASARVGGYAKEKEEGRVITLKPGEKKKFDLSLMFYGI